jgi:hypothetical protein
MDSLSDMQSSASSRGSSTAAVLDRFPAIADRRRVVAAEGLPRIIPVAVTIGSALIFYVLATHGTLNPLYEQPQGGFAGRFFFAQAQAMVHGHLYVDPSQLPGECFVSRGRCYGYEGLTPSLLRLPFLPLLNATNRAFTPVFMTAGLTLAVGSALAIVDRMLSHVRETALTNYLWFVLALSLGPGSVLVLVTRPALYEEPIVWSVAFALLAVYGYLRWWSKPGAGWAVLVVLSLVLSTNARPTTLPLGVVLGAGMVIRAVTGDREAGRLRSAVLLGAAVAILPVATCLGAWWLKFHTLLPNYLINQQIATQPWWLTIRRIDHDQLQGLRYVPTTLLAYLRPDGITLASSFPFVGFAGKVTYIGIPKGSMYLEPFSTLSNDMPLFFAVVIAALAVGTVRARRAGTHVREVFDRMIRSPMTYCVLGTAAACAVMLSNAFITSRYLADCFPLVVVGVAVAVRVLGPATARLSGLAAVGVAAGVTIFVAWSLLVNIGLDYQYWWHTAI